MKIYLISALACTVILQAQDTERVGKTHFILPHHTHQAPAPVAPAPAAPIEQLPAQPKSEKQSSTCVFFAPDDNLRAELIKIIDGEKEAIQSAIFMVTDKEIAHALVRAKQRGVDVQLIVDVGCLKDKASKIPLLAAHGCTIFLYDPTLSDAKGANSLMHHKFALFKNNKGSHVVWTGSYNFTRAASESNRENVIILRKKHLYDKYLHHFDQLKNVSYRYERKTVIK